MAAYEDELPYYQSQQKPQTPQTPQTPENYSYPITPPSATPIIKATSSSGCFADAIKEGWTLKKGPQTLAGWKKRYLQLSANKQLGYYTDESMVAKKGTIFLNGLTIHQIKRSSKTSDSKHHGFCVVTDNRTYQFCVPGSTDRDHWIQKIREVVDEKWDAHKIGAPSISYSSGQRDHQIKQQGNIFMNGGKVQFKNDHKIKPKITTKATTTTTYGGFNNNAYDDWDDDDDDINTAKGTTMKIRQNILNDNISYNEQTKTSYDDEKEDRFAHRSKYKRRNQENEQPPQIMISEEEAQQKIQELEEKNDNILDEALMTSYETQEIAADTAQKLDDQRHQLMNVDKNLHEIDQDLDKTEGILDGMKSWGGMIKRKLKKNKDPQNIPYQAPIANKSTFQRNQHQNIHNNNNNNNNESMPTQISQYEHDNVQNEKLDELLKNVKAINQTANDINTELDEQDAILDAINDKMDKVTPRMQQQNKTMKKLCD